MSQRALPPRVTLLALLMALTLSLATGVIWELQNDEGVTFSVSVGDLALDGSATAPLLTPAQVYARIDGQGDFAGADVLAALRNPDQMFHPPAFYLATNLWARWVGTGHLAMRLPSYLLGLASVLGLGLLALRMLGSARAAGWVMMLAAASPWLHGVDNFLRPYALALCVGTWATLAVARARPGPLLWGWRLAFVLLSALGLLTVYHYSFVVIWHGLVLLALASTAPVGQRRAELGRLVALSSCVGLLFLPWLPTFLEHMQVTAQGTYFWSNPDAWADPWPRVARTLSLFFLGEVWGGWGAQFFRPALGTLAVVTALLLVRSIRRGAGPPLDRSALALWIMAPLMPALVVLADLTRGAATSFVTKYVFLLFPLLLLALVRACVAGAPERLGRLLLAAWLVLLLAATATDLAMRHELRSDYEAVAEGIAAHDDASQLVVLSSTESRFATPLVLTLRDEGVTRSRLVHADGASLAERVALALADPSIMRLVLVRFEGGTPHNDRIVTLAYQESWLTEVLAPVIEQGRAAGWDVHRGHPAREPQIFADGTRVLVLADGARAKRFHGNY